MGGNPRAGTPHKLGLGRAVRSWPVPHPGAACTLLSSTREWLPAPHGRGCREGQASLSSVLTPAHPSISPRSLTCSRGRVTCSRFRL